MTGTLRTAVVDGRVYCDLEQLAYMMYQVQMKNIDLYYNDRSKFVGSGLNADVLNGFSRAIVMLRDASKVAKMNHSLDDLT